jgi:2-keto-4-pentenoate hydratase/2-oxohepta-3-ene-1,7-dioic acid hydratase in catechol pathway
VTDVPFVLGMFDDGGDRFGGVVAGDRVARLDVTVDDIVRAWDDWFPRLGDLAASASVPVESLRVIQPLAPRNLVYAGANYKKHLVQLAASGVVGEPPDPVEQQRRLDERARTGAPMVMPATVSAMTGPHDDVVLPRGTEQNDWELELAMVIGRPTRYVSRDDALDHVAAYVMVNDVTTRERLRRADMPGWMDWLAAKCAPTFFPTGPWVVPAAFVDDPQELHITLKVNGEVMQDESTADMMFDCRRLLEHASSILELQPGDVFLTGSPAGNGAHHGRYLQPGDVMEGEITHLGQQRNVCVEDKA